MEKNIATLMREDCRTIHVEYNLEGTNLVTKVIEWESEDGLISELHEQKGMFTQAAPRTKAAPKRRYTYVTDLPVCVGDFVVVIANDVPVVALVRKVDDSTNIEPNSDVEFFWVICKVELEHYRKTMAQNLKITQAVAKAYKANLRRGFAQQVLLGMPEEQKAELENLIKGT